jgi:hypothetical protein
MPISRNRTAQKGKGAPGPAKLPAALAKRAEQAHAAKQARLAEQAREDIALVERKREVIADSFYDIGEALVRLKRPGVAESIGRKSFRELCEKDLSMSLSAAEELIAIVTNVPRGDALRMGQERARALVHLAKATPELDTPRSLEKAKRKLPSGNTLDVSTASTRDLHAAAKEIRGAARTGRPKGRTTTEEERARAARLQTALHGAGVPRAKVTAVATKPGQEAELRIEHIPVSALAKLRAALGKKA